MPTILGPANTYSTTVTGGTGFPGDEATGHGMREFVSYIDALEPWNTSFYSRLKKGPSVWKSKVEWGVRKQLPHTVTIAEALTAISGADTITFATGHGQRLMKGSVLYIPEDATGNAAEILWLHNVDAVLTTDTWTNVIRAQGGTSGVVHDINVVAQVIGVAVPDMADHPEAPIQYGDLFFNRRQRFPKKITVDSAEDIQKDWENQSGGNFEIRLEQAARQIKLEFEKGLILGRRQDGTPDPAGKRPSLMSGLEHFAVLSTNTYDLNGALLNYYDFEEVLRDGWNEIDANFGDTFMMNMNTKSIFDTIINIKRRAEADTTMLDLRMEKVRFSPGTANVLVNRYVPNGMILAFRFQDLMQCSYVGLDWHFARKKPGIDTDGDYSVGSISSDRTFVAEAPATLAVITDFNDDISAYPVDLSV